jgi:hypothetical protein
MTDGSVQGIAYLQLQTRERNLSVTPIGFYGAWYYKCRKQSCDETGASDEKDS